MPAVVQKISAVPPEVRVAKNWKLPWSQGHDARVIPHDNPDIPVRRFGGA